MRDAGWPLAMAVSATRRYRSTQALAGHTRKIGFVEKGENESPAALFNLIGRILYGKRQFLALLNRAETGMLVSNLGFERLI